MTDWRYREATLADASAMAALHEQLFPGEGWATPFWEEAARRDHDHLLLAERANGEAAGLFAARAVAGEADILTFGVLPPHRGQGIGAALLTAGLAHLEAVGTSRVVLEVRADNLPALALYRRAGFIHLGERPDYYGPGAAALLLAAALPLHRC